MALARMHHTFYIAALVIVCVYAGAGVRAEGSCVCTYNYDPVCGKDGNTYSNACFAECQVGQGNWTKGRCEDELNPTAGCIGTVKCKANPCDMPWPEDCSNELPEHAVCFINSCSNILFHGEILEACSALWVDPTSKRLITCNGPPPTDDDHSGSCKCTRELNPVCGNDGTSYDNPCLAACSIREGSFTTGRCPCICTLDYQPVCGSDGVTYPNACAAGCHMAPGGTWTDGECPCVCTEEYQPVCGNDGVTYSNLCFARCKLGTDPVVKPGRCNLDPFAGCLGNVKCASNACATPCPGVPEGSQCFQVTCGDQMLNDRPVDPCSAVWVDPIEGQVIAICPAVPVGLQDPTSEDDRAGGDNPGPNDLDPNDTGCICTQEYAPVCDVDGKTYSNSCMAKCDGATLAHVGECGGLAATCPPSEAVMCFANPCNVAFCPADPKAACLSNYCSNATYRGDPVGPCGAIFVDVAGNPVKCRLDSDQATDDDDLVAALGCPPENTVYCFADPCRVSSCPAHPDAVCLANYCDQATYRGQPLGPCQALYVDEHGLPVNCGPSGDSPTSGGVESYTELQGCPDNHTVACFANPCEVGSCPAYPDAACVPNYCTNATYRGLPLGPCQALFLDPLGDPLNCTQDDPMAVTRITNCPLGGPVTMCKSPYDACLGTVCGGHPDAGCINKNCYAVYRNETLMPCRATWYDKTTGDLLACAKQPNCSTCPDVYAPVCATDGKTYPNRCVAECLGMEVKRPGKCQHCNGGECLIGKKNDLCVLGSASQCWTRKYDCRLPDGASPDSFLGKCLPKPTPSGRHRLRL